VYQTPLINLDQVPYCFKNKDINQAISDEERDNSTFSLEKLLVIQNRIKHLPELQCFAVKGESDDYLVKLFSGKNYTCT